MGRNENGEYSINQMKMFALQQPAAGRPDMGREQSVLRSGVLL